ncbi:MAG: dATP pyrophosphohydrolase [Alphaproteobacteria bacterium]|nr:dATP pyrophosphohydrolase [Alphaproteobacteria bacterium]MBU1516937.1 dATP pyrophosphohydrolase [Alphaproteobacteria bacterium]MBU2095825.1 dATP pyrophosphohydrolase [Alphaproteobacteria bacterium]MBU2152038.1 dATP pyrophosphohydrolase [Alphaproteobacteria bacterium]MBU2309559.1 dATP pyrophosphohydrolase [Alphaproteobacteria bacterium]
MTALGGVEIVAVQSKAELDRFIRVPMRLGAGDPNYIAPLILERGESLTAKGNPFFEHADVQFWLAVKQGRDVGRISAQIDHLNPQTKEGVGHFGMIAAEDDAEVFAALFATAEAWLKAKGCKTAIGPVNLSTNEEVGLLVEGHDTPPMFMMSHDPRHTPGRIEGAGYARAKDIYAYVCSVADDLPAPILRRIRKGLPEGVTLRTLEMKRLNEEVQTLTGILNDAWSGNWGFTPTTEAETKALATTLSLLIDARLAWFAEIDGEAAGFMILLPNINEAIADLKGKLFPFGVFKLLWRLKVKGPKTGRVPLMGVKRKFAQTLRGQLLPFHLIDAVAQAARKQGYERYELSWILEDNLAMRRICDAGGAKVYKTYRLYEKALG